MFKAKLIKKIDDGFTSNKLDPLFDFLESGKAKIFMYYGVMNIMAWLILPETYMFDDGSVFHIREVLSIGSIFFLIGASLFGGKRRC